MTDSDLRAEFLLRDDVVFLNHGSFGACPRPVFEQYQRLQRELEAQPLEFLGRQYDERMAVSRAALAGFVGCGRDDLVYVPNATHGLNIVARSLRLEPGDEVVASDHEYGALDRTWRFLCGKRGAVYKRMPVPLPLQDPQQVVEAIWAGVTARTRVLFLSHITAPTALIFPVAELVRRARERGILTVVDGAHAPGQIPLDLTALGADFYAGNCHKWLMAPKGAAFLHARPEVQELLEPLIVSWGWESREPGPSRFVDHHQWSGTREPSAWLAVPAALEFLRRHDWDAVRDRCFGMLLTAREEITAVTGLAPICPPTRDWFVQIHSLPLPAGVDGPALQTALRERFAIEIPVFDLDGRCFLRASAQGYNRPADYAALVAALKELL